MLNVARAAPCPCLNPRGGFNHGGDGGAFGGDSEGENGGSFGGNTGSTIYEIGLANVFIVLIARAFN